MKIYLSQIQNIALLILLAIGTSCNGQIKTGLPEEGVSGLKVTPAAQPKMVKTQSTDPNVSIHWNVHCSLQDRAGNLWFGTTGEGVYRYDGKSFVQFTVNEGLSNNVVWSILEDKAGGIWFGTDDGVSRYDGKSIAKMPITIPNANGLLPAIENANNAVWSMMQDKSGTIWFGTTEGVYCYKGKSFSRFLDNDNIINENGLQLTWIQSILEDRDGITWMGSGPIAQEGVIRYDGKSLSSSKPNGDGWIRHIVEDKDGTIWFGGRSNGVFRYDGKTFTNFTEKEGIGSPMMVDEAGNIWFDGGEKPGTGESDGGIWCYDGKSFKNFTTNDGLGNYSVWSMLEDNSGNIWVGTRNVGLYRFDGKTFASLSE